MERKNAVSFLLASKKDVGTHSGARSHVPATGVVVRSTKVMITERHDVPVVHAVKKKIKTL